MPFTNKMLPETGICVRLDEIHDYMVGGAKFPFFRDQVFAESSTKLGIVMLSESYSSIDQYFFFFFTETSIQLFTVEVRINGSNIWHYFAVDVLLKIPLNINYKHFSECSLIFFHRFFELSSIQIFFLDVSKHIFDCMPLYV